MSCFSMFSSRQPYKTMDAATSIAECQEVERAGGVHPADTFERLVAGAPPGDGPAAAALCTALAVTCERHDANRDAAGLVAVQAVVDILRHNDPAALLPALRAVRWLAGGGSCATASSANLAAFGEDACKLVVARLREHVMNPAVAECGSMALAMLARSDALCDVIVGCGGVAAVCAALRACPASASAQAGALCAAANLMFGKGGGRAALVDEGVEVLVTSVRAHAGDVVVQEYALLTIANLTVDCSPALAAQFVRWAIAPLIAAAMFRFPASVPVQHHAARAITNLAVCGDAYREGFETGDAVPALLAALAAHHIEGFVSDALLALGNLCFGSPRCKALLYRVGAVEKIIAAMRELSQAADVQVNGLAVVYNLCTSSSAVIAAFAACGAVAVTAAAMAKHRTLPVQMSGTVVLGILASCAAGKEQVRSGPAVKLLREAAVAHADNAALVDQVRAALACAGLSLPA